MSNARGLRRPSPPFPSSGSDHQSNTAHEWELRPGGMLVQKRSDPPPSSFPSTSTSTSTSSSSSSSSSAPNRSFTPSSGPLLSLKVSYGQRQHDVAIPSEATFGELKRILAPLTGLRPREQRLLFRGKEREDSDFLHIAGVDDKSRITLVEDPASKEKKWEEMKGNERISRACQAVSTIREVIDKLASQVSSLEMTVNGGTKVVDSQFTMLSELLMRELLKLDTVEAEGEAKVQRKIEVRRVQGLSDRVDQLKVQNSNPLRNNTVVVTKWQTFNSGVGSLSAPPPSRSSNVSTNWELFD